MAIITLHEGDNVGGILKVEIAYHFDFSSFNPVEFSEGKQWEEIEIIPENAELREKVEEDNNGIVHTYSGGFSVNRIRSEVSAVLNKYMGARSVMRLTDLNYQVYIIGLPGCPVTLKQDAGTGERPTQPNGYNLTFSVQQITPAVAV